MIGILNGSTTHILKLRRVWALNIQTGTPTGVICQFDLRFRSATATWGSPTSVSPVTHDTTNGALASCTAGHAGTPAGGTEYTFRRYIWSSDEPAVSSATSDELECIVPFNLLWDSGYGDSNVQPITLRQDQMVYIYNVSGAAGAADFIFEFTDE
jgi:hypothetical protein